MLQEEGLLFKAFQDTMRLFSRRCHGIFLTSTYNTAKLLIFSDKFQPVHISFFDIAGNVSAPFFISCFAAL